MRKKYNYIKKLTSSVALLTLFVMPKAEAHLDPKALKEMSRYFKPEMMHYSPVIGESALVSLMHDFRFYGSLDMGEDTKTEERVFTADKPHMFGQQKDAFFKLMYELFRSPAGTLNPQVAAEGSSNFHSVVSPQKVALLLNYTQELSRMMQPFQTKERGIKADNLKANHERDLPKKMIALRNKYKNVLLTDDEKKRKGLPGSVHDILISIENCIVQECTTDPEKKFLYPDHTTEQIILAYFCQNSNTQKDVLELLSHLNENIIAADQRLEIQSRLNNLITNDKTEDDLLTSEDLEKIAQKTVYSMDDVYALAHTYLFDIKVTPYFEDLPLISNGPCYIYDRTDKKNIFSSYADCAETAARHLMNMIVYNAEDKNFNFIALKNHMKNHDNPYFENFLQFYELQTPEKVNNGTLDMRSWWNRVVGDLNKINEGPRIRYLNNEGEVEYELDPGIMNFLNAFDKIFSLSLDPLKEAADFEDKKAWIKASFLKLSKVINPDHRFKLDFSALEDDLENHDVRGKLLITVQNKNHENLFKFDFSANPKKHGEIKELKVLKKFSIEELEYKNRLLEYKASLFEKPFSETMTGVIEDIWLSSKNPRLIDKYIRHPLYKLLNQKLDDNDSKIIFLKNFINASSQFNLVLTRLHKEQLKQITRNVLKSLSWEDSATFKNIKSALNPLLTSDQTKQNLADMFAFDGIQKNLSPLTFKDYEEGYSQDIFSGIKYLDIKDDTQKKYSFFQNNILKKLNIASFVLETLEFTQEMENLSYLNLYNSTVKEIKGIYHLSNLKILLLMSTENYESLEFTQKMEKLSRISLNESNVNEIKGFEYLSALKVLDLEKTKNLEVLEFTQKMPNLSELLLDISNIREIKGLEYLPALKVLDLGSTKNLETLEFTQKIENFFNLNLCHSNVKEVKGLHHLLALRKLNLRYTKNLDSIEFTQEIKKLSQLFLNFSSIKEIKGLHHLSALQELSVFATENLESLEFTQEMKNLTKLNLEASNIKEIKGLHYLSALKELDLRCMVPSCDGLGLL